MNKTEFVCAIAEKAGVSKKAAADFVNAYSEVVADTLAKGGKVQLIGFGTYEVRKRSARQARNPRTGATVKIAATKVPAFKAGAALKAKVAKK